MSPPPRSLLSVFHVGTTTYDDDNVAFTETTLLASLRMACSNNSGDITRQNKIIEGNFGWEGERVRAEEKKKMSKDDEVDDVDTRMGMNKRLEHYVFHESHETTPSPTKEIICCHDGKASSVTSSARTHTTQGVHY